MVEATNELFKQFKKQVTDVLITPAFKEFEDAAKTINVEDQIKETLVMCKKGVCHQKVSQMLCQVPPPENGNITDAYKSQVIESLPGSLLRYKLFECAVKKPTPELKSLFDRASFKTIFMTEDALVARVALLLAHLNAKDNPEQIIHAAYELFHTDYESIREDEGSFRASHDPITIDLVNIVFNYGQKCLYCRSQMTFFIEEHHCKNRKSYK